MSVVRARGPRARRGSRAGLGRHRDPSPPNFGKLRAASAAGGAGRGRGRSRPLTPAAPSRPRPAPLARLKVCGRPCAARPMYG
jgi:hypothetical protein